MVDRPWTVVAPPAEEREYLALVSFLPLKRFRMIPRFLRYSGAVSKQLVGTRGLVGFSFRAKILAREFYTLSVWEDERALDDFVRAEPHRGRWGRCGATWRRRSLCDGPLRAPRSRPPGGQAIEMVRGG